MNDNADKFRPTSITEFVGQKKLMNRLMTHVDAAVLEARPLEHTLLAGPPGFGKTTLAGLIAGRLEDDLLHLTMPVTEKVLQAAVTSHVGVLFLDELHSANQKEQEMLLPLLEFGHISTKSGAIIEAAWITVIAATTEPEKIIEPLTDRFRIKPLFEDYSSDEMAEIVINMAIRAELDITEDDAIVLGGATGGIPRNAGSLVLAGKALQVTKGSSPSAEDILEFCEIDRDGLDPLDYRYLTTLAKFGGQRGIKQIATVLRQSESVCMNRERLLFQLGLINYESAGRILTQAGYRKVKEAS